MKVLIIYFSATGNTAKIATVIDKKLMKMGAEVSLLDITSQAKRPASVDITPYDAVMFGSPIYSSRMPKVFREWLANIDGQGKKCAMFFTYGGFAVHPAHYSTRRILEKQNFTVVSSAEFLGAHTFNLGGWEAMADRPDKSDYEVAEEYVLKTYKKFTGEDNRVLGEFEKGEHTEEFLNAKESSKSKILTEFPDRKGESCSMCSICETVCPTGAMDYLSGKANAESCIACLACVANCPDSVLKINDMSGSWASKCQSGGINKESMNGKRSRIYL